MSAALREIVFDTETTGLDPSQGDRLIELGAVELINHVPSGRTFRRLVNPGRPVSEDTVRITGITDEILHDCPLFEEDEVVGAFLRFVGDAPLVAHNAAFDRGFLDMELQRCGLPATNPARWVDTLGLAKRRFPGAPASLDALCRRFDISLESRTYHGALLDAQLTASVYLELLGGRARRFDFAAVEHDPGQARHRPARARPGPRPVLLTKEELAAHAVLIEALGEAALWRRYC